METRNRYILMVSLVASLVLGCLLSVQYLPCEARSVSPSSQLIEAILQDDVVWLEQAFSEGLDPDMEVIIDGIERPLLHSAALADSDDCVALIVSNGADVLREDYLGRLAVEYALLLDLTNVAKRLAKSPQVFDTETAFIGHAVRKLLLQSSNQTDSSRVKVSWNGKSYDCVNLETARQKQEPKATSEDVDVAIEVRSKYDSRDYMFSVTMEQNGDSVHRLEGEYLLHYGYWLVHVTNAWDY